VVRMLWVRDGVAVRAGVEILRLAALAQDDYPHWIVSWKMERKSFRYLRIEREFLRFAPYSHPGHTKRAARVPAASLKQERNRLECEPYQVITFHSTKCLKLARD
jgi:hypothetical protein